MTKTPTRTTLKEILTSQMANQLQLTRRNLLTKKKRPAQISPNLRLKIHSKKMKASLKEKQSEMQKIKILKKRKETLITKKKILMTRKKMQRKRKKKKIKTCSLDLSTKSSKLK